MWYPQKLLVKNLMSHTLSGYEFKNGNAVMINGINECDEEQESNGSGKSAILEGISMTILGAPLRDASAKELIKDDEAECETEMLLWNSQTNQTMSIWRKFYSNTKSAELEIFFDDKPVSDMTSVRHGNEIILDALGIAREDLLNYYLLSKEKYIPFLKMSDTKKKEMIGRFSQSDLIDPTIAGVDFDLDAKNREVGEINRKKYTIEAKIEVYVDELANADLVDAKKARAVRIENLEEEIEDCEEGCIKAREQHKLALSLEEDAEKEYKGLAQKDFSAEREKLDKKEKVFNEELSELKEEHEQAIELQARVTKSLLDAVECPKCEHEFSVADDKINIANARKNKSKIDLEVRRIEEDISEVKKDIRIKVDEKRKELREQEKEQREKNKTIKDAWEDAKDTTSRKKRELDRAESILQEKQNALIELKDTPIVDGTKAHQEQIDLLNKDLEKLDEELSVVAEKVEGLEELKATLVKFKTHLSNKAIGAIEAHANHYLEKTGTDISIQLDGYKATKAGKVRENISATIYRNGEEKGSLGKFSGGEKARTEIALIMAPQKLINMNCASGGLDLLFLDEVIESVDSAGIGGIMKSLNMTGQTILVITHGTFDQAYPYVVEVVKQSDGVSIIKT